MAGRQKVGGGLNVLPAEGRSAPPQDIVYRSSESNAAIVLASLPRVPRVPRGSNIRAFQDPMTLQQAVPGLRGQPGGAILEVADSLFDIAGTAEELRWEERRVGREWVRKVITRGS